MKTEIKPPCIDLDSVPHCYRARMVSYTIGFAAKGEVPTGIFFITGIGSSTDIVISAMWNIHDRMSKKSRLKAYGRKPKESGTRLVINTQNWDNGDKSKTSGQ